MTLARIGPSISTEECWWSFGYVWGTNQWRFNIEDDVCMNKDENFWKMAFELDGKWHLCMYFCL